MERDCGHRCSCARAGAERPPRRRAREEECGKREDEDQPRDDERRPAQEPAEPAAKTPRAVDRELGRGRTGEEVAGGERVFEVRRRQPAPLVDAELAQQRDMCRRPAEADAADPAPLTDDRGERGCGQLVSARARWRKRRIRSSSSAAVDRNAAIAASPPLTAAGSGMLQ